jgi:hypothetical protein
MGSFRERRNEPSLFPPSPAYREIGCRCCVSRHGQSAREIEKAKGPVIPPHGCRISATLAVFWVEFLSSLF